jgi:flagellar basal-body rod protein FlgG
MLRSLWIAASGMTAQQTNIDNLSNNLANVNTVGFKKARVNFEDLLYQEIRPAGAITSTGLNHPTGIQLGMGSKVVGTEKLFSQGSYQNTDNPLDWVIEGDGFFQVLLPNDEIAYTRNGSFKLDQDGNIVNANGYYLEPQIAIPEDALEIMVSEDGIVSVMLPGEIDPVEVGNIEISTFINPSGLRAIGRNLFLPTAASGDPIDGVPGDDNFGIIVQGMLEMSNVNLVEEMVNMITAQRAYEVNSKAIQTSDDMLQIVNNLRR